MTEVMAYAGWLIYVALGLFALWGTFCVVLIFSRIKTLGFRSRGDEERFIKEVSGLVRMGKYSLARQACEEPGRQRRALVQMTMLALTNRAEGVARLMQMLAMKFQRTVLAALELRLSWINTVAKSAPMLGLLGTVVGMIGAFGKIAGVERADPSALAQDISLALFTTAIGLVIAIPMVLAASGATARIRRMEGEVEEGLQRVLHQIEARAEARDEKAQAQRQETDAGEADEDGEDE